MEFQITLPFFFNGPHLLPFAYALGMPTTRRQGILLHQFRRAKTKHIAQQIEISHALTLPRTYAPLTCATPFRQRVGGYHGYHQPKRL
jgi:hypothetical protein